MESENTHGPGERIESQIHGETSRTPPGWLRGDLHFHADIPGVERNFELSHAARRSAGDVPSRDSPALSGRTYEEVNREAARIRLGERFKTFPEFDRSLDSWGVLNGRASHRLATKSNHVLRTCRFGCTVRKNSYVPKRTPAPTVTDQKPGASADMPNQGDLIDGSASDLDHGLQSKFVDDLEESDLAGQIIPDKENLLSQPHRSRPLPEDKNPLAPRNVNQLDGIILSQNQSTSVGINGRQARSYVQHTSKWLPPHNPSKNGRRVPKSGACGQLNRLLPTSSSQDKAKPCPFRVRANKLKKSGAIKITKCDLKHTCPAVMHRWRGPTQKSGWLAITLANRVVQHIKAPVADLIGGLRMDYKKSTNYYQAWRAKDKVKDWYLGGQKESFGKIPGLLDRMKAVDPQCIVDWSTESKTSKIFKKAFVCPSATRSMVQFCQPLISLDACHTKNRKYPTNLFMATALDGNGLVVILCYALAPTETKKNWIWFLELMLKSLDGIDSDWMPLISDRAKGLVPAIEKVFPGKKHAYCAHHIRGNVKDQFGKAAADFFIGAVYANTKQRFDEIMEKLQGATSNGRDAVNYIRGIDPKNYARFAFPLPRMGKVTSNPAEQANSGLLPIRQYALCKILVELWFYIQMKHKDRKKSALQSEDTLSELALRRHLQNKETFGQWQVLDDAQFQAKVQTIDMKEEYLVGLHPTPTCSCWELQDMIWPCQHVMAWDDAEGRDYNRHFHDCWLTSSLRAMYEAGVPPFLCEDLQSSANCVAPEEAVRKGRHRIVRIPSGGGSLRRQILSADEYVDKDGDLLRRYPVDDNANLLDPLPLPNGSRQENDGAGSQQRRTNGDSTQSKVKCGKCGKHGHNRRTCGRVPIGTQSAGVDGALVTDSVTENVCVPLGTQHATVAPMAEEPDNVEPVAEAGESTIVHVEGQDTEHKGFNGHPSDEDEGDDSAQLREICDGRSGHSQNYQQLDWAFHLPGNWEGVSQVQMHLEAPAIPDLNVAGPATVDNDRWWE